MDLLEQYETSIVRVINAWVTWSKTHDVDNPKLACCETTDELFASLEALAKLVGAK